MTRKMPAVPMAAVWVAAILIVVAGGSRVGAAIGSQSRATIDAYPRVAAPGAATISLDHAGSYDVYYESVPPDYSMHAPAAPVRVTVVDARGAGVRVDPATGARRTEFDGRHAGVAVASFAIIRPGGYRVTVDTGVARQPADVAIGLAPGLSGFLLIAPPGGDPVGTLVLLAGLSLLGAALGLVRWRGVFAGSERHWRRRLAAWSLVGPDVDEAAVAREVQRCWARLSGASLIGIGLGAGLGTLLLAAVLQATSSSWFSMPGLIAALYLGLLIGGPIGYGAGVARIRRATAGGAAYADLRPRRPRDYVSPVVRWLGAAPALALCLLTVLVVAHRPRPLDQVVQVVLLLAGMLATLAVAELLLAHVVAVPRLVVTADPEVSRRADDMLRSHFVVSVQSSALLAVSGLGIFAVARLGVLAAGWLPDAILFAILLGYVTFVNLSLFLWLSRGRLGGRITGWPWSGAMRAPEPGMSS